MKKKNKNSVAKKKAALKRAKKRSDRLKSTQKDKPERKKLLIHLRKKAEERFEQQMKDLFGKKE